MCLDHYFIDTVYIIYINCIVVLEDELYLYADDASTRITLTGDSRANQAKIQEKAADMQAYMDSHHLRFNSTKMQILVKKKGVNNTHGDLKLEMDGKVVNQSESVKVQGIIISQDKKYSVYLVTGEKSMFKYLDRRQNMLKLLSRYTDFKTSKALEEGVFGERYYRAVSLTELFRKLKWLKIKDTRAYHDTISLQLTLRCQTPEQLRHRREESPAPHHPGR